MSRYLDSVCKLCRREGEKLFLKGRRCNGPKCSFERRSYPPGQHGQTPPRRGREKQLPATAARQTESKTAPMAFMRSSFGTIILKPPAKAVSLVRI